MALPPDAADEVRHRVRHRVDVPRGAGDGLREHPALRVIDAGGKVARLAHRGGEGGADQRLRLLLHHRDQAVPHHLVRDQGLHGASSERRMSRQPSPATIRSRQAARGDDHRGLGLGDDGGAREPGARRQSGARVDRDRAGGARVRVVELAHRRGRGRLGGRRLRHARDLCRRGRGVHRPDRDLRLHPRDRAPEEPGVIALEMRQQHREGRRRAPPRASARRGISHPCPRHSACRPCGRSRSGLPRRSSARSAWPRPPSRRTARGRGGRRRPGGA